MAFDLEGIAAGQAVANEAQIEISPPDKTVRLTAYEVDGDNRECVGSFEMTLRAFDILQAEVFALAKEGA